MADEIRIDLVLDEGKAKKSADKLATSMKATFAGVAAVAAAAWGGKKFVDAAMVQEEAVEKLNASLRNMGKFTKETSKELQDFASQLQNASTIGDEVVLDQLAFAQAMGASVDQSKDILKAAADMSSALGIDLNSSVRNISKTLGGYAGELGEVIPELKNLTAEQLKAGLGVELLAGKYKGFALAATKTFGGGLEQLSNSVGDMFEKIGDIIVKSPLAKKIINVMNSIVTGLNKSFSDKLLPAMINGVNQTILTIADLADAFSFLVVPIEHIWKISKLLFNGFKTGIQGIIVGITKLVEFIGEGLSKIPFVESIIPLDTLRDVSSSASDVLDGFLQDTTESITDFTSGTTPISDRIRGTVTEVKDFLNTASVEMDLTVESLGSSIDKGVDKIDTFGQKMGEAMKQVSASIKGALVKTASMGIQTLTKSLVLGEKGFSNFGKAVASMMGDLAIQMGELFIGTAMGMMALSGMGPAAALAAGLGLVALGTIMKSFAGGDGGGVSVPSTGGSTIADSSSTLVGDEEALGLNESGSREKQQSVQLVVHGDVLDSEETGTRLVNLLNENFENSGGKLITA